ncbi:MAG: restriction endonuclease subunit S [Bryobacteraceae bacterium]|jgi:type I restriction enzyme S subunit
MVSGSWKTEPLGKAATLQRGFDLPYHQRKPGLVPIVTSAGTSDTHCQSKVTGPGVVTGRYGTIGEVFYVQPDFWPLNTTLYVKNFHGNDPLFVSYLLRTIDFHTHSGKSGVPGVNRNDLHEILVRLPQNRVEQEAIAGALSDADALIESLEKLIGKKRHLKQGAMQELLTGRKRLPGFSGKWSSKTIGDLANMSRAAINPATRPETVYVHYSLPAFDAGAVPVKEPGCLIGSNKLLVPQFAVLLSKLNPRIPRVWVPAQIPDNAVCSTEFLVLTPREGTDRNYLAALCLSKEVRFKMKLNATGTTGSHQRVHPPQVMVIQIAVPEDKGEQTAIATVLSDMDAEMAALETKLAKARQIKQGMMQSLLTGRIRLV